MPTRFIYPSSFFQYGRRQSLDCHHHTCSLSSLSFYISNTVNINSEKVSNKMVAAEKQEGMLTLNFDGLVASFQTLPRPACGWSKTKGTFVIVHFSPLQVSINVSQKIVSVNVILIGSRLILYDNKTVLQDRHKTLEFIICLF